MTSGTPRALDLPALAMGLAFALMWSSAFTSARMIVADAPPLHALALRFLVSGTLALALGAALGQSWRVGRAQVLPILVFGLCQNALYLGLNFVAMQTVEASLAAIIASTMPLLVALIGRAAFGTRVGPLGLAGLAAGFAGVALIMGGRLSGGLDLTGLMLCGAGSLALAVATLTVRTASGGGNLLAVIGWQMLAGSALLAPAALLTETFAVDWTPRLGLAFAYTTLVPGLVATWIWFALVGRIGAVRAATFHFLNPFFGVAVAALLLGEPLRPLDLAGVAIIMAGILAVQRDRASARPATDPGAG